MRGAKFYFLIFLLVMVSSPLWGAQNPKYGGTVVVSNRADITSLNPVWKYDSSAYFISQNIYSTLIISDYGVARGVKAYGDLAKNWDVSPDSLTYTFHLNENVYWHDGVKFSADDVKFTYDTAIKNKYPIAQYLASVKEILAPDKNTIVFKMSKVDASFLPMLAQASNWFGQIIPKHIYEGTDIPKNPMNKTPVGTGPFKFEEWQSGQFVSVKANDKYFRGRPYLDKVVWRLYTNPEVAQADFRSGNLDLIPTNQAPPARELKALEAQPGIKLWKLVGYLFSLDVVFNHTRKPMNDVKVREAICLAVDRDEVSQLAWSGLVAPNYNASCPGAKDFTNFDVRWPKQDLDRAKKLLDQAGYPPGPDGVRMRISTVSTDYFKDMTEIIIQQLKKIGVEVKFNIMDQATWFSRIGAADFDLISYWIRFGPDPDAYREHFGSKGARNYSKYSNTALEQLLEEGLTSMDLAKRKQIYDKVQEILRKDFVYLPVTEYGNFEVSKENLFGNPVGDPATYGKSYGRANYQLMWIDK
jgi:peptide/nickel transport system substrate-binding protein